MRLKIDLIPESCFYKNVRSNVTKQEWDIIRKRVYKESNYVCSICEGSGLEQGFKHPVECHEIFEYNLETLTQTLVSFESICPMCHKVHHIGLSGIQGFYNACIKHFCKVNNCTMKDWKKHEEESWNSWKERSKYSWKLNIDLLKDYLGEQTK